MLYKKAAKDHELNLEAARACLIPARTFVVVWTWLYGASLANLGDLCGSWESREIGDDVPGTQKRIVRDATDTTSARCELSSTPFGDTRWKPWTAKTGNAHDVM